MCFTNAILNSLGSFLPSKKIEVGIFGDWLDCELGFFHKCTFKSDLAAQVLDFTACFGHMVLLFSFSYEGDRNLSGSKAEGRGADSDMSLRDDVYEDLWEILPGWWCNRDTSGPPLLCLAVTAQE